MSLISLTSSKSNNNSKLFFSKYELNLILSCYSFGVVRGNWKDYSINSNDNEAKFCFYKHTFASPEYSLIKYKKNKKNKFCYKISFGEKVNKDMENIDKIITFIKRKNMKIVK
tara:strand:+ start:87 stop:425 length:339 start_codon:yes stop_codon:yes gene_type:complete